MVQFSGVTPTIESSSRVISGYGPLPKDIAAQSGSNYFCIDLELDPVDFEIVDFACTKMPCLGEKIFRDALLGCKVEEGVKNAIDQVEKKSCVSSSKVVLLLLLKTRIDGIRR